MKKNRHLLIAVMLAWMAAFSSYGQTTTPVTKNTMKLGRPWYDTYNPVGIPATGFTKTDVLNITTTQTSWMYDFTANKWYQVNMGFWTPGPAGPPGAVGQIGPTGPIGPPGRDGQCPECPTSGSTVSNGQLKSIGKIAICYNDSDVKAALKGYEAGTVSCIWTVNDVGTQTGYDIPLTSKNESYEIPIYGWGSTVYDATTGSTALESIWRRRPLRQGQADSTQGIAVVMKDMLVKGRRDEVARQPMTGTLMDIGGTYGSNFDNVDLRNGKNGFMGRFCMMSEYAHSKTVGVRDTIFAWTIGPWPGASGPSSNAQSNSSLFRLDRAQATSGTKVCFYSGGSSNVGNDQCVAEQDSADYGVLEQDLGSPNDLDGWTRNLHVELGPRKAAIEVQKKQGGYVVDGLYFQKNGVMISTSSVDMSTKPPTAGGYVIMDVRNLSWITPGNQFKFNSNGAIWNFSGTSFGMDVMNTANWPGGVLPAAYSARGFKGADDNSGVTEFVRTSKKYSYGNAINVGASIFNGTLTANGKQISP